ncbi:MbtH family protein [Bradyrhizobium prioriisuperbiae]|uniref:MbtH family protein n=1 Tax=Bradyrhizobium prioriisuperbiae TaxID=2854389 RepID=UPI0028E6F7D4|nr:MbtH family NRPS accessory protein [Bradyrhizobium prioritasuperba]
MRGDDASEASGSAVTQGKYRVVVNDEEQFSIWSCLSPLPIGWNDAGFSGDESACLEHIVHVWTNMTPRSLRSR